MAGFLWFADGWWLYVCAPAGQLVPRVFDGGGPGARRRTGAFVRSLAM